MLKSSYNNLTTEWKDVIEQYPKLDYVEEMLAAENKKIGDILPIYPLKNRIFRCFNYFNPQQTKVVIVGQDPYHGENQAIGLCFGVEIDMQLPPSLRNIKKELQANIGVELKDITLEKWAKQGVLLLNTALTVRKKCPASHMKIWKPFTEYIIEYINRNCDGIVFVAWGGFAHRKLENIDREKHHLIVSSHPSPLSVYKQYREFPAFKGSQPFSKINNYLEKPIAW